jgi:hypothetical protein
MVLGAWVRPQAAPHKNAKAVGIEVETAPKKICGLSSYAPYVITYNFLHLLLHLHLLYWLVVWNIFYFPQ